MRLASVFAIVLTLGMVGSAYAQPGCDPGSKQFLVGTGSYSYGHNTQSPSVGSPLSVVGKLNKSTIQNPGRPINYDMASTSEYTFYISGVDLDQFVNNGTAVPDSFRYGGGGTIAIYYDTSADAPNSPPINPPNGTVPANYTDGSPILVGSIDDLLVTFRDNSVAFPDSVGEIRGRVTFTGGDSLGVLVSTIWVWNATVDDATVPVGFNWRWSGELKNDCVPAGACCFCDGTCQNLTEADCDAAGGVYQGDGTNCATTTCPLVGACCLPDGSCAQTTQGQCEAAGGTFYACTPCDQVVCVVVGACCLCDGTCLSGVTADACAAQGGVYQGDNSSCATITCPLVGACCLPDGSCVVITGDECAASGGLFYVCTPCEEVTCTNAVEPKTWGGIKGLYR